MDIEEPAARPRLSRKRNVLVAAAVIVLVAIGGGTLVDKQLHASPIPKSVRNQAKFTLYYPSQLPLGWSVDTTSFAVNDGIVFYKIEGAADTIVISIQPRPKTFDASTFYKDQMTDPTLFDTTSGDGAIGTMGGRLMGSMMGGNSWVFLSPSSSHVTQHDLRQVITSLKKS